MTNTPANDKWFQHRAEQLIHMEQLKRAELFNGRAAMLGIVIGIVVEGLTLALASPTKLVSVPWWMATPPAASSLFPSASEILEVSGCLPPRQCLGVCLARRLAHGYRPQVRSSLSAAC